MLANNMTRLYLLYLQYMNSFMFPGNNIYGSEICRVLQGKERMAYILMDKIRPTPTQNYLLRRDGPLTISNCLSELGVFGAYVRCVITISLLLEDGIF